MEGGVEGRAERFLGSSFFFFFFFLEELAVGKGEGEEEGRVNKRKVMGWVGGEGREGVNLGIE